MSEREILAEILTALRWLAVLGIVTLVAVCSAALAILSELGKKP